MAARSIDPRTGAEFGPQFPGTAPAELESLLAAAAGAAPSWAATGRPDRAALLAHLADRLDATLAKALPGTDSVALAGFTA